MNFNKKREVCQQDKCAIEEAVRAGNEELVKRMVDDGATLNDGAFDPNMGSLLHLAIPTGNIELVKYLLALGALNENNVKDDHDNTPLHIAVTYENKDIIKLLLAEGSRIPKMVGMKNSNGDTPLYFAIRDDSMEALNCLIKHSDSPLYNNEDDRLLMLAVNKSSIDMIKCLVEAGYDINKKNICGDSLLHNALRKHKKELTEYLLNDCSPNMNATNNNNESPLYLAVIYEKKDVVQQLIQSGVDVNISNRFGIAPISIAVKKRNIDMVEMLVNSKAGVELIDYNGESLIFKAVENNDEAMLSYLLEKTSCSHINTTYTRRRDDNNVRDPLSITVKNKNLKMFKYLLEHGATINSRHNLLCAAAKYGNVEILQYLVTQHEKPFEIKPDAKAEYDLLTIAVNNDQPVDVVQWIVENGYKEIKNAGDLIELAKNNNNNQVIAYLSKHERKIKEA